MAAFIVGQAIVSYLTYARAKWVQYQNARQAEEAIQSLCHCSEVDSLCDERRLEYLEVAQGLVRKLQRPSEFVTQYAYEVLITSTTLLRYIC